MSTNEILSKIKEFKELQALIEEASAELEALKEELKKEMGGKDEVRIGEYKISSKKITSSRFDTTAFKKAMPELADKFTKKTEYTRFSIA